MVGAHAQGQQKTPPQMPGSHLAPDSSSGHSEKRHQSSASALHSRALPARCSLCSGLCHLEYPQTDVCHAPMCRRTRACASTRTRQDTDSSCKKTLTRCWVSGCSWWRWSAGEAGLVDACRRCSPQKFHRGRHESVRYCRSHRTSKP
jgi:hypothetical protein